MNYNVLDGKKRQRGALLKKVSGYLRRYEASVQEEALGICQEKRTLTSDEAESLRQGAPEEPVIEVSDDKESSDEERDGLGWASRAKMSVASTISFPLATSTSSDSSSKFSE